MVHTTGTDVRNTALTRERLVSAALVAFSTSGFDGVSARQIERAAGVERGLAGYHFGSKQALWEAAVDVVFTRFIDEMGTLRAALRDVSRRDRARALIKAYGRFNARHPEFFRIVVLEGHVRTERSEHLAKHLWHGVELFRDFTEMTGPIGASEAILIYQLIGAAGTLFAASAYFEQDINDELHSSAAIEVFAERLAQIAVNDRLAY